MKVITIVALVALAFCIFACLCHFFRIIRLGKPNDLAEHSGSVAKGVVYANTQAMMPQNKESAYRHLPTYAAGMIFHLGTFLTMLLFVLSLFKPVMDFFMRQQIISLLIGICLAVGTVCGIALFIKRGISKDLQPISNVDDYISNAFTTLFQACAMLTFFAIGFGCSNLFFFKSYAAFHLAATLLFLYLPFGKLRHVVYYFAARYHLGFFYGSRNTWPPKKA